MGRRERWHLPSARRHGDVSALRRFGWMWRWILVLAAWPWVIGEAGATNGNRPRTPPTFVDDNCRVQVDRSVDPVFALEFGMPLEDAAVGVDELSDSRTFQFFALCRDHAPDEPLPAWITMDDAQRAFDAGIIETLPDPVDVLELAPKWRESGHDGVEGSCVHALQPAQARVPIACGAIESVSWDTSGVPVGDYVIRGYTFEPPFNLWTPRLGVVVVSDSTEVDLPSVAIMSPPRDADAFESPGYRVVGCADGSDTQVTLSWAKGTGPPLPDEDAWQAFDTFEAAGAFDRRFVPPAEAIYQAIYFRAVASDLQGQSKVAYSRFPLVVRPGCGPSNAPVSSRGPDICRGLAAVPPEYEAVDCEAGETGDDSGGDSDDGPASAAEADGCACRAQVGNPNPYWWFAVVCGVWASRRRLCQSPRD